ncbi:MAG: IS481 family transposase [Elusimicrobiota bacterium]
MNYTKRLNPTMRIRMIELAQSSLGVKKTCELLGISRNTYYKWLKRLDPENIYESLSDRKPVPRRQHKKTQKEFERIIIKIYDKLRWSSLKIHCYLKNNGILNPSTSKPIAESTIRNILKRYGRNIKKITKEIIIRYEKEFAGEMAHIDLKKLPNVRGENPKNKKYLAVLEDDATRLTYAEILDNKKSKSLADFLKRGCFWFSNTYEISFESLLSDNGKEFTWHTEEGRKFHSFEVMCRFLNIKHKYTKVRRPQTNGKVERFNRTIDEEFLSKYLFDSHKHRNISLQQWLRWYNAARMHMGIKGLFPVQKLAVCRKMEVDKNIIQVA